MLSQTKNKKAISIMIGYVLLVTFAIIMSAVVYQWMKTYIPKDTLDCPDGVSIYIKEYRLEGSELSLTLKNNGLFSIGGFFITASENAGDEIATIDLSKNLTGGRGISMAPNSGVRITGQEDNALEPNEEADFKFDLTGIENIAFIEIVPIRWQEVDNKQRLVSCSNAKIKELLIESEVEETCEVGEYTGEYWTLNTANTNPQDIAVDSSNFSVIDENGYVYMYDLNGNYGTRWLSLLTESNLGIATNGTRHWIIAAYDYNAWVYDYWVNDDSREDWSLSDDGEGISYSQHKLWLVDQEYMKIDRYNEFGVWEKDISINSNNANPTGIAVYGDYMWVVDETDDLVYEYSNSSQELLGTWSLYSENAEPTGIATNGNYIWVVDSRGMVYKYYGSESC